MFELFVFGGFETNCSWFGLDFGVAFVELVCDISRAFRIRLLSFALCFVRTEADVDGDGTIDYVEFFLITRDELEAVMKDYGVIIDKTVIKDILNEVDTDHDGRINYEEYYSMMRSGLNLEQSFFHF
ncbi:hypothetical protein Droror1_Dr00007909 [Drosera rotundifolia]